MASSRKKTSNYRSITRSATGTTGIAGGLPMRDLPVSQSWLAPLSVAWLVDMMMDWRERARQRRLLARMDQHMLRDIGLSLADVEQEIKKPFWRL